MLQFIGSNQSCTRKCLVGEWERGCRPEHWSPAKLSFLKFSLCSNLGANLNIPSVSLKISFLVRSIQDDPLPNTETPLYLLHALSLTYFIFSI